MTTKSFLKMGVSKKLKGADGTVKATLISVRRCVEERC